MRNAGNRSTRRKTYRDWSKGENQQKLNPHMASEPRFEPRATLEGGERSHHPCAPYDDDDDGDNDEGHDSQRVSSLRVYSQPVMKMMTRTEHLPTFQYV